MSMGRTVLDRGITGACSICWILAVLVMVFIAQLMTSYKLKSKIEYYIEAEYYEDINGTSTFEMDEVFDEVEYDVMGWGAL